MLLIFIHLLDEIRLAMEKTDNINQSFITMPNVELTPYITVACTYVSDLVAL